LQTIALLAYLAAYKGIWGPHLVIVPTSCIVNWETEIKRFCPSMKVLCYYGSAKKRKELRTGWTKSNWHHVVVTSYQLVVQDAFAFKRKKWYYMILDEAQNIKNFQSQRWQTLINFNTQRRLLLTGTPLQNNLMELWSLLHFLMPHVFRSRKEFSYWFSNPMNSIIEGNTSRSDDLISRLHGIIRPFVLRRLKKDVESQMPGKYEHIVKVQMSRRQMFLYEEFMARSSTRTALKKGGNFMGMMNVLMQLRKVCNHPDLFEPRSVITPFAMERLDYKVPGLAMLATTEKNACSAISKQLLLPLWSVGMGMPAPEQSVYVDSFESEQLSRLSVNETIFVGNILDICLDEPEAETGMGAELTELLTSIRSKELENKLATKRFQGLENSRRCVTPPFPYSLRLLELVRFEMAPIDRPEAELCRDRRIISTPSELLAAKRTHLDRADDLDEIMKKFVFCIPRAGASRTRLDGSLIDRNAEEFEQGVIEMLAEPLEEYFYPFRQAQARLSSFFPDKKLVQFDAGKLQTLSRLLRDLKQGGHRVLIFTQMSKMLDTLEAFLNLNGHTYLRLDGSTGVDRRQRLMDKFNNDEKIFCFILSTRSGGLGINLTGADTVIFYVSVTK
jgi:SNF2 family DNA or RNA helicase